MRRGERSRRFQWGHSARVNFATECADAQVTSGSLRSTCMAEFDCTEWAGAHSTKKSIVPLASAHMRRHHDSRPSATMLAVSWQSQYAVSRSVKSVEPALSVRFLTNMADIHPLSFAGMSMWTVTRSVDASITDGVTVIL